MELAQLIQNPSAQVQSLAGAGGTEAERVGGVEQTTRQLQGAVQGVVQRQGTGVNNAESVSNLLVGKSAVPEGFPSKSSFKQWSPRYKLVAGARDERFNTLMEWVETRDLAAPTVDPATSNTPGVDRFGQHVFASLLHPRQHARGERLEAWRRLVQRFDSGSAHAHLNLMSRILKLPKGKANSISFVTEKWEDVVMRIGERTGRQALTDDMKRAIIMEKRPSECEKHLILNADRFDTYPKSEAAVRYYVEQICHMTNPMEIDAMAHSPIATTMTMVVKWAIQGPHVSGKWWRAAFFYAATALIYSLRPRRRQGSWRRHA